MHAWQPRVLSPAHGTTVLFSRCATAGTPVTYTITVVNSGNVKLRSMQLALPTLSGSTSNGTMTCMEANSSSPWADFPHLPAAGSLACSGSYIFDQDAIERGSLRPMVIATAANLAQAVSVELPEVGIDNAPSFLVKIDTPTCRPPAIAGEEHTKLPLATVFCMQHGRQLARRTCL